MKFEQKAASRDGGVDCAIFFVVSGVFRKEQSTLHYRSPESCGPLLDFDSATIARK